MPHLPRIEYALNNHPFKAHPKHTNISNRFTFESALIRGDDPIKLNQVLQQDGTPWPPRIVEEDHVKFLERNLPSDESYGTYGLQEFDPTTKEVAVPWLYRPDYSGKRKRGERVECYDGFALTWKRDVGKGGFGVASLWKAQFPDGHSMNVVIKTPVHKRKEDSPNKAKTFFADERAWHERYRGAANITQSLDLNQLAAEHRFIGPIDPESQWAPGGDLNKDNKGPYAEPNTLVLEYMKYSNLGQLNHNLAYIETPQVRWPCSALWYLLSNLTKGLAEMAYNQTFKTIGGTTFAQRWAEMNNVSQKERQEFFNSIIDLPVVHDVHFDMEEYNILVGLDGAGQVTFKLHDFSDSHSHAMNDAWQTWSAQNYWVKRTPVKPMRCIPEQHDVEWDRIPFTKSREPKDADYFRGTGNSKRKTRIAGRYGMWSNIFIIGKTLECCMTGIQYTHPFTAKAGTIQGRPFPSSYGWRLFDREDGSNPYPHLTGALRELVVWCMRPEPGLRPTLPNLLSHAWNAEDHRSRVADFKNGADAFFRLAIDPKGYAAGGSTLSPSAVDQNKPLSFEKGVSDHLSAAVPAAQPAKKRAPLSSSAVPGTAPPASLLVDLPPTKSPGPARPYEVIPTPSDLLECGLHALILSIEAQMTDVENPTIQQLRYIVYGIEFQRKMKRVDLKNTNNFTVDQLAHILSAWGRHRGLTLGLGYFLDDDSPAGWRRIRLFPQEEQRVVYIHNDNLMELIGRPYNHFSGVRLLADPPSQEMVHGNTLEMAKNIALPPSEELARSGSPQPEAPAPSEQKGKLSSEMRPENWQVNLKRGRTKEKLTPRAPAKQTSAKQEDIIMEGLILKGVQALPASLAGEHRRTRQKTVHFSGSDNLDPEALWKSPPPDDVLERQKGLTSAKSPDEKKSSATEGLHAALLDFVPETGISIGHLMLRIRLAIRGGRVVEGLRPLSNTEIEALIRKLFDVKDITVKRKSAQVSSAHTGLSSRLGRTNMRSPSYSPLSKSVKRKRIGNLEPITPSELREAVHIRRGVSIEELSSHFAERIGDAPGQISSREFMALIRENCIVEDTASGKMLKYKFPSNPGNPDKDEAKKAVEPPNGQIEGNDDRMEIDG